MSQGQSPAPTGTPVAGMVSPAGGAGMASPYGMQQGMSMGGSLAALGVDSTGVS
jgi:hypothetical protein